MEFDAHRLYSSATLKKLVQEYLPEEFVPLNWSCHGNKHMKSIQNLLDNSCGKLRIFTSADEMLDHLNVFGSYPGAFRHIGAPITDHYVTDVTFHYDFKKEAYVYKKDIFSCLYQCFLQRPITSNELAEITIVRGFLAFYMRSLDFKHEFNAEIVHFPAEDMKNFYEATEKLTSKFRNTPASKELKLTDDQMVEKWRSLINLDVSDKVAQEEFEKFLQRAVKSMPFNGTQKFWSRTFEWVETAIADCTEFITRHERQFMPRACLTSGSKAFVRLFTAEGINIVMVHELLQSMKQENIDVSSIEEEIIRMPRLAAWTFREVAQKLGSEVMKNIVFVTIEVPGSSFRTQPIPTIDGGYCILATDGLFEILNHIISVKKFFQVIKMDQPSFLENFFESIREDFKKTSSFYFVNIQVVIDAKKKFDIFFEKNLKHFDMTKATSVRNLKDSVFTKEDVRKELKHLNLDRFFSNFPDVRLRGVAEMLITILNMQVVMAIPGSSLLSSIFDMHLPCNRPRIETSTNQEKAKETESQKSDSGVELKSEEDSDASNQEQIAHPEEIKKKTKRSKKTTKSISEDVSIPPKESQSCPKCIRASEYTTKTNEKLRLSKIEVKHLKKELSVVELALEEKNERIRILEEKLRENENELSLKSSEVETLNTKSQELEQMNKRNERLIATSHEVISKKDMAIESWKYHNYEKDKLIKALKANESKAIPSRSAEESEKVDSLLSTLLETKMILSKEDPLKKSSDICDSLISKVDSEVTQQLVEYETKVFQLQVSSYRQIVENNIKLIRGNQHIKMDQIPEIPDFPEFSEKFKQVYKSTTKKEAPLLCRQLLKLTDEIADMECVICINDMESHDDTTKCGHCKRRYHNHCIKSWLMKKSICPTCKHGMVDEQEFPAL